MGTVWWADSLREGSICHTPEKSVAFWALPGRDKRSAMVDTLSLICCIGLFPVRSIPEITLLASSPGFSETADRLEVHGVKNVRPGIPDGSAGVFTRDRSLFFNSFEHLC